MESTDGSPTEFSTVVSVRFGSSEDAYCISLEHGASAVLDQVGAVSCPAANRVQLARARCSEFMKIFCSWIGRLDTELT